LTHISQKILITGASGYIGQHLCAELAADGHYVIGTIRSPIHSAPLARVGAHPVVCPAVEVTNFQDSINNDVDIVIHLAAHVHQFKRNDFSNNEPFGIVNVHGTENAAKLAIKRNASLFILASTVAVFGDRSGTSPLNVNSPINPITPYAHSKLAAESAAADLTKSEDLSLKILRIPMIYGKDAPGNFQRLCKVVASGMPLPLASATAKRNFLYVFNFVSAIREIIALPENCPQLALIADDEAISVADLIQTIATTTQSRTRLFPFPKTILERVSRVAGQHHNYVSLFEPMEIDSADFCHAMRWSPPFTAHEALLKSI
jgi:nucleoside-diphosphate-sugar epimerase